MSAASRIAPHALFFPAAAGFAAIVVPSSVLAMAGLAAGPASLATPFGHAHEMLLGYALAVVAGYQLPAMSRARAVALVALWIAARLAFVAVGGAVAAVLDGAFAVAVALHVTPRLFRAAKKLRNKALPAVLLALCGAAVAYDAALVTAGAVMLRSMLAAIVLLLAALMLFMGGRIIAPAVAGQRYRQGESLDARVQPTIEAMLLGLITAAVAFSLLPAYDALLRVACTAAGALAIVRLSRWQAWKCRGRPDLLLLAAGYAWLGIGLLALGAAAPGAARAAALHVVTIGALGTLTLNLMANTALLKARRIAAGEPIPAIATALIGVATLLRVAASFADAHAVALLLLAASCWSAAFVAVAWLIGRCLLGAARQALAPVRAE